jgi:uncharacterized protein (TIGR03086 family)
MSSSESIADRYRRAAARFTEVIGAVDREGWSNESPCEGWTALDVLHHVVTTEADLWNRMTFATPIDLSLSEPNNAEQLASAWIRIRDIVQPALDTPAIASTSYEGYFGPTTFEATIDRFYTMDLLVHAWDIAAATRLDDHSLFDAADIEKYQAEFADLEAVIRQPGLFGPRVELASDATEQQRFLSFLGRREPSR